MGHCIFCGHPCDDEEIACEECGSTLPEEEEWLEQK